MYNFTIARARRFLYYNLGFIHYNNKTELKRSKQTEKDDGNEEEEEVEAKIKRISNETEMRELDVIYYDLTVGSSISVAYDDGQWCW